MKGYPRIRFSNLFRAALPLAAAIVLGGCALHAAADSLSPTPTTIVAEPTSTASATPTAEPTMVVDTPTIDPTSTPQPTNTPEPTSAPEPTATATPAAVWPLPDEMMLVSWQWKAFLASDGTESALARPEAYTLTFLPDGRFSAVADCNALAGNGVQQGDGVAFVVTVDTGVECGPDSDHPTFAGYLADADSVRVDGGRLLVGTPSGTMVLERNSESSPLNGAWTWAGTAGSEEVVASGSDYVVEFGADGSVQVKLACNRAIGAYQAAGNMLTVSLGPVTLAECGDNGLGQEFLRELGSIRFFSVGGDSLQLKLGDGRTMSLVR